MDTNIEDKMYRQIEKNLSNNINENLFTSGRLYEEKKPSRNNSENMNSDLPDEIPVRNQEDNRDGYEASGHFPQLSRAEYIRQAREACLRQMNSVQAGSRMTDITAEDSEAFSGLPLMKKTKSFHLFHDETEDEASPQEVASFHSLMIRTVCSIVLFLSIFLIDKLEVKWGDFSNKTVQEYVIGNDQIEKLETFLVSWLK